MEWKSFADEKPELDRWVVVCSYPYVHNMVVIRVEDYTTPSVEITHWMYIPELELKKEYPAPKIGTVVTEENIDEFTEKFAVWLLKQGLVSHGCFKNGCFKNCVGFAVGFIEFEHGSLAFPCTVTNVEDTDTITWIREEL